MESSVIQATGVIHRTFSHELLSTEIASPKKLQELPQPFDEETSSLDAPSKRWKPLVGTPSKSPIPHDILVPDPSPPQFDPESPVPGRSTPTSFVHKRRQGEYVPRPPVWTVRNPDGGLSDPAHKPDLVDNMSISSSESVALDLKRASHPKHETSRASTDSPNYTHAKIPNVCDDGHGDAFAYEYSYVKMPPRPEHYDHRKFSLESSRSVSRTVSRNGSPLNHKNPEVAPVTAESNPLIERNPNSIDRRVSHLSTASFSAPSLAEKRVGWIGSDYRKNIYSFMEGPARSVERISSYIDLRFSPTARKSNPHSNKMVPGSVVISVGRTVLIDDNGNTTSDFGVHINRRYIVAEIYGDYWALLIKLEPGLQLGERERSSNLLSKRAKPKPPIKARLPERTTLLGVHRDPEFIVFAPLCAFTLDTDPERSPQSRPVSLEMHETVSARGYAQATTPTYSAAAEAEAKGSRWTFIPEVVYYRYVYLTMKKSERAGTLPILDSGAATNGPQRPSGTENIKPTPAMRAQAEWKAKAIEYHSQTGKPIKNTTRQSIRDFFSGNKSLDRSKLASKISEVNESAVNDNGADDSRPDRRSVVSEIAPKVELQSLPASFQDFSLNSQLDRSSDHPPIYPDANVPLETNKLIGEASSSDRKSASLETRASSFTADTPLSSTKPDPSKVSRGEKGQSADIGRLNFRVDTMPSSTEAGEFSASKGDSAVSTGIGQSSTIRGKSASSAELAVPVERSKMRNSSDPTPRPKEKSPLTMPPAHIPVRDIVQPVINNQDSKNANKSTMNTLRAAGETMKRVFPAIIERCRKSNTQTTASIQGDGSVRSTSSRFIEPCKSIARSLTNRRKSHQRKSILSESFKDTSSSHYQAQPEMQPKAQPVPIRPAVGGKTISQKQRGETPLAADPCSNGEHKLQEKVDTKAVEEPSTSATLPEPPPSAEKPQQKEHANLAEGPASAPINLEQQRSQKHLSALDLPPRYKENSQGVDPVPPEHLASAVKVWGSLSTIRSGLKHQLLLLPNQFCVALEDHDHANDMYQVPEPEVTDKQLGEQGQLDCGSNVLDHLQHFLTQPSEDLEELNAFESVDRMLGLALDSENRMEV